MNRLNNSDKAGLYITVIIHVIVVLILLFSQIGASIRGESSFLLDFSAQEEMEKKEQEQKEEEKKESFEQEIARRVEDMIRSNSPSSVRNVAIDRRAALKDDRNTDAKQLYEDAERLAKDLKSGVRIEEPDEDYVAIHKPENKPEEKKSEKEYSGPSVVSYSLEGRKASKLPIPAYRCYGGGMVTVIIAVDNAGNVVYAKVQDETSTADKCLRDFAVRAARMSKFSVSPTAPARQAGDIVYQFIAQ